MESSSDALAAQIEVTRGELSDNLKDLSKRVSEATNWRIQYERHTMLFVGAAIVGGLLLARVGARKQPSDSRRSLRHTIRPTLNRAGRVPSVTGEFWREVKGAIGTVVGSQIRSWLNDTSVGNARIAKHQMRRDAAGVQRASKRHRTRFATSASGQTAADEDSA